MSTSNHIPFVIDLPLLQRVAVLPSSALAGGLLLLEFEALATHPVRDSGVGESQARDADT
jgi:hypothetical protein